MTYDNMFPLISQSDMRTLREKYKVNRLILCSVLHVSLAMLEDFENGTVKMSKDQHLAYSRFFGHYKMRYNND